MKRFLRVTGLAVVASLFAFGPTTTRAESLAQALADAYEHSGLLDQNRALLRAADEDVAVAVSRLRPVVDWALSANRALNVNGTSNNVSTFNLRLSAGLLLYDFGATQLGVDVAKESVLGARDELLQIEQQVLLRAVQAYMNVQRESAFLNLRQNNVRVITQELRAAEDRFDVGEVTRTDVSLAEARLASARSQLAAAEGGLANAVEEFFVAVGRRPGNLSAAASAPVIHGQADATAFALRNHPDVSASRRAVTVADLNVRRAEAALKPTVNLSANLDFDPEDGFSETGNVGVVASGPIYQGGALSSSVRRTISQRDSARAGLHVTTHNIRQGVANAYSGLAVARASRVAFTQQVRASEVAFRGVREEATLGARTTLDVLNAEQELLDARANLVSAQVDEVVATYQVLFSMGLLTAEHLGLPVQIYDPAAYYNLVDTAPAALSAQGRALDRVLESIGE